jgi:hypothetical protein
MSALLQRRLFLIVNRVTKLLRRIRRVGHQCWKQAVAYHRRSLAETAVFRFKMISGNTLSARSLPRQITEAHLKAAALNRITQLSMPDSYAVA